MISGLNRTEINWDKFNFSDDQLLRGVPAEILFDMLMTFTRQQLVVNETWPADELTAMSVWDCTEELGLCSRSPVDQTLRSTLKGDLCDFELFGAFIGIFNIEDTAEILLKYGYLTDHEVFNLGIMADDDILDKMRYYVWRAYTKFCQSPRIGN